METKCQIDQCQRSVACLCRHCHRDLCFKHFAEHQKQMNDQLILLADRINRLKEKVQFDEKISSVVQLEQIPKVQHEKIDREFHRKIDDLKKLFSNENEEILRIFSSVEKSLKQGETTIEEINRVEGKIEKIDKRLDVLRDSEFVYLGKSIHFIRGKIVCGGVSMYAIESEKSMSDYVGKCPMCDENHFDLAENRGFYASTIDIDNAKYRLEN